MSFFFPKIIHPDFDTRIYRLENPDGSVTIEPDPKKQNRIEFNRTVGTRGYDLATETDQTNDELQTAFNLAPRTRPKDEARERRVTCIRALQRLVNKKTLEYVEGLAGEIINLPISTMAPSNTFPENPLDRRRFTQFEYLSQRPSWADSLYDYVENNILQDAYDELIDIMLPEPEEDEPPPPEEDEPPPPEDDDPPDEDDPPPALRRSTRERRPVERLFGDRPGGLVSRRERLPPAIQAQFSNLMQELTIKMSSSNKIIDNNARRKQTIKETGRVKTNGHE